MEKTKDIKRFEELLDELESIVEGLEADELDLEEAVKAFERGVEISKACHKRLDEAERKVRLLRQQASGEVTEAPFDDDEVAENGEVG